MANFFIQNPDRGLTRLTLGLGETITVGLYGGGPAPAYADLSVRSMGPSIKCVENKFLHKPNLRFFGLTATAIDLQGTDIVGSLTAGGTDWYTEPIHVTVTAAAATWGHLPTRAAIVKAARDQVPTAHYLWATAGNTPDATDSFVISKQSAAKLVTNSTVKNNGPQLQAALGVAVKSALDPATPLIGTAYSTLPMGIYICAGGKNATGPTPVGADLATKITAMKITDPSDQPATARTPRKYNNRAPVMGDCCKGARHFDCVGLVNYCVGMNMRDRAQVPKEIYQWMCADKPPKGEAWDNSKVLPNSTLSVVGPSVPCMDGDIVGQFTTARGWHHIGMVYVDGGKPWIVQAVDTDVGLTLGTAYDPSSTSPWTRRVRVADVALVEGGVGSA